MAWATAAAAGPQDIDRRTGVAAIGKLCPLTTHLGIFGDVTTIASGGTNIFYRRAADPWKRVPLDFKAVHSIVQLPNGHWLIGDTDNHRMVQIDDLAAPRKVITRAELAGIKLKRPHDELVDPVTGDIYVVAGDRRLFRFKDINGPVDAWTFTPDEMGYVRALSWFDGHLHLVSSSRGEVIRIDDFAARRYTKFRGFRPADAHGLPSTQISAADSRNDFDAGAISTTGLVLNDVDKYDNWYYGTNFFDLKYAVGGDTHPARLIRWRSWADFERGVWEDLSAHIPEDEVPLVPYFITIENGMMYIPAFGVPADHCTQDKILRLDLRTLP